MEEETKQNWIEQTLNSLDFVKWDRCILDCEEDDILLVYGWIDKDFVLLEFYLGTRRVYFTATSSKEYSKKISEILKVKHSDCINIKERFDVKNLI